jgi:transposase InsO family protein
MPRSLPRKPSLEYVRKEAKDLLAAHQSGDASVCDVLRLHHRFQAAGEADMLAERWRRHYNQLRPHSSLGYRPPAPAAIRPTALT